MRRFVHWTLAATLGLTAACKGEQGDTGPMGAPGTNGTNGAGGTNGTAGTNGVDGAQGPRGPQGRTVVLSESAHRGYAISPVAVNTASASDQLIERIGRGSYIVNAVAGCNDCHATILPSGASLFLGGGTAFELPNNSVVYARNLTRDATGFRRTEAEFIEVMRTGRDFKHIDRALIAMPWAGFRWMSDEDLRSIYAYLQAIPPVSNTVPDDMVDGPLAMFPVLTSSSTYNDGIQDRRLPSSAAPDPGGVLRGLAIQPLEQPFDFGVWTVDEQASFGRGSYIANAVALCNDCHTNPDRDYVNPGTFLDVTTEAYLSGGRVFDIPPPLQPILRTKRSMASNLSGEVNGYRGSFADFLTLLTQGVHEDGRPVAWPMPWMAYRNMSLEDLKDLYLYVTRVPRRTGAADKLTQKASRFCANNNGCQAEETCSGNECVGGNCIVDSECGACQTCVDFHCAEPDPSSGCLVDGI